MAVIKLASASRRGIALIVAGALALFGIAAAQAAAAPGARADASEVIDFDSLDGWSPPTGAGTPSYGIQDGQLRFANSAKDAFSHASLVSPPLPATVGAPASGADYPEIGVGFHLASATGGYQEGLSMAVALEQGRGDRLGGNVYFAHIDGKLVVGAFWYDPVQNPDNAPVSGPWTNTAALWSEEYVEVDPALDYDVTIRGAYADGLGAGYALNDTLTIELRHDGALVHTLEAHGFEGQAVASGGAADAKLGYLTFSSGVNAKSSASTAGGTLRLADATGLPDPSQGFLLGPIQVNYVSPPPTLYVDPYFSAGSQYKGIGVDLRTTGVEDATEVRVTVHRSVGGDVVKTSRSTGSVPTTVNAGGTVTAPIVIQRGAYDEAGSSSWVKPDALWAAETVPTGVTVEVLRDDEVLVEKTVSSFGSAGGATLADVLPSAAPELTNPTANYHVGADYKGIAVDIRVNGVTDAIGIVARVDREHADPVVKSSKPGAAVLNSIVNTGLAKSVTMPIVIQPGTYDEAGSSTWVQPDAVWTSTSIPTSVTVTVQRAYGPDLVKTLPIGTGSATAADVLPAAWTASPSPTVSGSPVAGQTLTASAGAWSPAPDSLSLEWFLDGASVATGPSYVLPSTAGGSSLVVEATGVKAGYSTVVTASAPILVAGPSAPPPAPPVLPTDPETPPPAPSAEGADGEPVVPPTLPSTPPAAGGTVQVSYAPGTFLPYEWVQFVFYSAPAFSASVQADASGGLSASIPVPSSVPGGSHTLAATGTTSGVVVTAAITVAALAVTGVDAEQSWLIGTLGAAVALWGVVAVLAVAVRRRSQA